MGRRPSTDKAPEDKSILAIQLPEDVKKALTEYGSKLNPKEDMSHVARRAIYTLLGRTDLPQETRGRKALSEKEKQERILQRKAEAAAAKALFAAIPQEQKLAAIKAMEESLARKAAEASKAANK